jgi:3-deoxy-manno-octulosonate cytidylyltransferase (CMP-KDO synthetase)
MSKVITLIPVRLAATRLPDKPLLDINGKTLIRRVYENCRDALPGDIVVAAGDKAIVEECERFGARAVLTDPALPSGTDRISAALEKLGGDYDVVVNFQGDNINVDPRVNLPLIKMVEQGTCDVATCGMKLKPDEEQNPNFVKICMGLREGEDEARVLYFTRAAAPYIRDPERTDINKDFYLHIGIYVFGAKALRRAAKLPVGVLEEREKLEQLRWLEDGMTIRARLIEGMKLVDSAPADVNTPEELDEARKWIK